MAVSIERVGTTVDKLGEGLLWDDAGGVLYWVDATEGILHRRDPLSGEVRGRNLGRQAGSIALRASRGLIAALEDGFYFVDPDTGTTTPAALVPPGEGLRFNDGKVDRQGRFVAGTMHIRRREDKAYAGALYRLDPDLSVTTLETGIGLTNGPCFSPDGANFYFNDSVRQELSAYDYDVVTGTPRRKRVFADLTPFDSYADGETVDADGYVWTTLFNAGKVVRFAPDGRLDLTIDMPVKHPTNVAFGGGDLDILYVTSLSKSPNFTATEPGAGGLFAIRGLGVKGLAEPRFAG